MLIIIALPVYKTLKKDRMEGMNPRLYSGTSADFHIVQRDQHWGYALNEVLQLATEFGFTSHYKDLDSFLPSK